MKNIIKTLNWINRVVFALTIILYTTIIFGLYAQVVLGFTQVISAIILLFFVKELSMKNQNRIVIYWGFTIGYGLLWLADLLNNIDSIWVLFIVLIPLSLASYFTYILESIKKGL